MPDTRETIIWEGEVYHVESAPRPALAGEKCAGCEWGTGDGVSALTTMSDLNADRFLWCADCLEGAKAQANYDKANGRDEYANIHQYACGECDSVTPTLLTFGNTAVCPGCFEALSKRHGF